MEQHMDSLRHATQRPALLVCHLVAAPTTLAQAFVYMPGLLCCTPQQRLQLLLLQETADVQPTSSKKKSSFLRPASGCCMQAPDTEQAEGAAGISLLSLQALLEGSHGQPRHRLPN